MLETIKNKLTADTQEKIEEKIKKKPYPEAQKFHHITFKYAIDGIRWAFKTQPNFKLHFGYMTIIILLSMFFSLLNMFSIFEYLVILVMGTIVFTAEMVNTSIEALSDEVAEGEYKDFIRISKDTAAGAVFLSFLFEVVIWAVIFVPKGLKLVEIYL